jgi:hypothetical protein
LRLRLGIATGLAVVGDLIGEGAAQERGVVGETPNLAARLQALAVPNALTRLRYFCSPHHQDSALYPFIAQLERAAGFARDDTVGAKLGKLQTLLAPGTLVIGEATRRQIGGLFDLEDLGPQQIAGFAEPRRASRVIGESGMLSRFEALRSGETPFVGRDEEVELLIRRWQQAKSGEGRVVLISGEPGIGKSRLTVASACCIRCPRAQSGTAAKSSCNWRWGSVYSPPRAPLTQSRLMRERTSLRRKAARRSNGLRRSTGCGRQHRCPVDWPPPGRSPRGCSRWPKRREMMDCGSRRIIASGRRGDLGGIQQKLASTPTPAAFSTIRRSMRRIVSSMADMIPAPAPDTLALRPNGCSDIPTKRSQASLSLWRWRSGSPTRSR